MVFSLGVLVVDAGIVMLSLKVFNREEILVNWK
jgi:hypothetical protein